MTRGAKPFVFVVMPFSPEWNDTYELGIRPACEAAGAECARVDEQIFLEAILDRIYAQIERADLIIAEMTGRNPNVFYETGFAHGLAKPVILLTKTADDIPFDLRQYPHIVHGGSIASLKRDLEKRVRWCIENPEQATAALKHPLTARVRVGTVRTAGSESKQGVTGTQEALRPPSIVVDGKHCPRCGGYISFMKVLSSYVYRFKCPRCGSFLEYEGGKTLIVLGVLGYFAIVSYLLGISRSFEQLVFGLLLWTLSFGSFMEVFTTWYIRERGRLRERGKR